MDEILNLIESVSEVFSSYSYKFSVKTVEFMKKTVEAAGRMCGCGYYFPGKHRL